MASVTFRQAALSIRMSHLLQFASSSCQMELLRCSTAWISFVGDDYTAIYNHFSGSHMDFMEDFALSLRHVQRPGEFAWSHAD